MATPRTIALACIALGTVGFIGSAWALAQRILTYHAEHRRDVFAFEPVMERSCSFAGRSITLEDDRTKPEEPYLVVRYGDQSLRLRVTIPGNPKLPGLVGHSDWMGLYRFALISGRTMEQFKKDLGTAALPDRLLIVTRTPRAGVDARTWGEVWMKDWMFDFYEFRADGTIAHERLRYPTNRVGQPMKDGELRENTWQFQAAVLIMPQAARERLAGKTSSDAMAHLGWTLPAAALFGTGVIVGIAFAARPSRGFT